MRFRNALFFAAALACAPPAFAAADAVKAELAARLRQALAETAPTEPSPAAAAVVESGRKLWTRKFRNGKTLAACFPNGGRRVAAAYPQYDPRLKRVVTLAMAVNQCLKANGEAIYEIGDSETMGVVMAYLRSMSDGQKMTVRVTAAAEERFEEGRRLYFTRQGQRNFACASCHVQSAGKRYDDARLSPAIGQATHWPVIRDGRPVTMQMRIRECLELMGAAPFAFGSDELNHLEYFLGYLSNGLALKANAARPAAKP
jgi:sulfur-oxidizing protein SoxA